VVKKRRGLRFLPGGAGKYVDSLLQCLEFVATEKPDEAVLEQWFFDNFPQTRGEKAVKGYINMVANQLGLIKAEHGKFVLTTDGERFLSTRDNKFLFQVLDRRVNGVHEVLRIVETPKPFSEIDSALRTRFGWKTGAQTYYRVCWLQSMGYVAKTGNTYGLTEAGKGLVGAVEAEVKTTQPSEQPSGIEEIPNHNEIRDMISEIGGFEGWISEVEYPIDKMRLDVVWRRIKAGNPSHAFEVQVGGNFYEALTKLKHAWDKWNSKPFLVTTEKYELEAKQLLEGSFHEIQHVTRIVNWKKIRDLHEAEKKAHFLRIDIDIG
jgi:predicted RNA-binding protein